MPEKIRFTPEELSLMHLFQSISGATVRDCIIDSKMNRVIFVINKGEMGLAIGRNGVIIKNLQKLVGKSVDLVEFSDDPKELIRNSLNNRYITDIRLTERVDGSKIAVVVVDQKGKSAVIGKGGRNAEKARLLAKRYFNISNVHIVSQ
ncbi:MAG: NusA-like transcription termination signal-binding factor [Nitrososphaerales archaeon]